MRQRTPPQISDLPLLKLFLEKRTMEESACNFVDYNVSCKNGGSSQIDVDLILVDHVV